MATNKKVDMPADEVVFDEVQRFRQPFILVVMLASAAPIIGVFGYAMISQLIYGRPFGDRPMSDTALAIVGPAAILFAVVLLIVIYLSKLQTEVRRDGLYVRFYPFHLSPRKIPLEKVISFRAVTYRPIWDYGGWGLRWRPGGRAYNVSGRQGVRLEFDNGKHLLIGSQRAEELAAAIETLLKESP